MNFSGYAKIALFFIILGVCGGAYIIASADNLSDFNTREYETIVADATGLTTRSKIYQAGVVVGKIKSITLSENEAILRIALLKDLQVREGAVLSRRSSSILGTSVLSLEPGNISSPVVSPGGRLKASRESGDLSELMGTVQDMSGQISQLLYDFQQNQLALLSISLETFNSIAKKLDDRTEAELDRVSRILEAIVVIIEEIGYGQGNISQAIHDNQIYSSVLTSARGIETAVLKLQEALDTINSAGTNIGSAAEGIGIAAVSINDVVLSAGEVIDSASLIVNQAAGLGVQVDSFANYNVMSSSAQAGASIRLIPSSNDRWYRVGVSSAPNGYNTRTVTQTMTDGVPVIIDTTVTDHSTFLIDAEIARTFGILTIRGGLIETTGGIGLDVQPLKWLGISGEVFNFRSGEMPNLRGTVTIYPFFNPDSDMPWNWIYIKGGVNNSLTSARDFFIGAGLRFADREVKGLVGLIPALN